MSENGFLDKKKQTRKKRLMQAKFPKQKVECFMKNCQIQKNVIVENEDKFIPKVKQRSFNKVSKFQMNSINCLSKTFHCQYYLTSLIV